MKKHGIRNDLESIAKQIPPDASYLDAMQELYVRMKISQGKEAMDRGKVKTHDSVKKRFMK